MALKMMQAWVKPGDFSWVKLDKTIQFLEDDMLVKDPVKLQKALEKEMAHDPSIIGIVEAKGARIKIHDNGKFSGIIWGSRTRISGMWTR